MTFLFRIIMNILIVAHFLRCFYLSLDLDGPLVGD